MLRMITGAYPGAATQASGQPGRWRLFEAKDNKNLASLASRLHRDLAPYEGQADGV
ncbi:hypothetical protein [Enterobacter hormaechei]|uniref:hypothetical protein n=1 Tax=Enterobacter hormaechei TaxID=158836 RepID=UPI00163C5733|nr:hypothetical protein [Enterobacter hormaechei]